MRLLAIKQEIHMFDTCAEFAQAFDLGEGDLVLSNEYIYEPYFGALNLKADVIYQEKYGRGEPSDEMLEAICADIRKDYKRVIAIGGGTIIDLAKFLALEKAAPVLDLYDAKVQPKKARSLVIVPTTCGTGSEVTNISILELKSRGTKMGLARDEMHADQAVLVPELLKGLPYPVFATSSIDALIHAMESSLSPKANEYTKLFGYRAIEMILGGYMEIAKNGKDARIPLLGDFLIASNYAGVAFGNAGVAAVHALSYPLGGKYHVPHGEANYCLLTEVFKKYMELRPIGEIEELNRLMANILECETSLVYDRLEELLENIITRKPMREYGVTEADLDAFTQAVMTKQGRLTANNYAPLSETQVREIYEAAY